MATAQHHPAHKMYLLTLLFLGITVLFGFIAVFVPWAMKDLAPGQRAWAYPFKTCVEETFSSTNKETCQDNDFMSHGLGVPVTGGSATCQAFILSTIAFVFISVIGGVVVLLCLAWVLDQMWTRPTCIAAIAQCGLVLVCVTAFLAWIMFICYAENTCAPDSIFPVQGYSYGFILYIFASTSSVGAVVTGFMGMKLLKGYEAPKEYSDNEDVVPLEYPTYDPSSEPVASPTPEPQVH